MKIIKGLRITQRTSNISTELNFHPPLTRRPAGKPQSHFPRPDLGAEQKALFDPRIIRIDLIDMNYACFPFNRLTGDTTNELRNVARNCHSIEISLPIRNSRSVESRKECSDALIRIGRHVQPIADRPRGKARSVFRIGADSIGSKLCRLGSLSVLRRNISKPDVRPCKAAGRQKLFVEDSGRNSRSASPFFPCE